VCGISELSLVPSIPIGIYTLIIKIHTPAPAGASRNEGNKTNFAMRTRLGKKRTW
jgi:hypothetical protein